METHNQRVLFVFWSKRTPTRFMNALNLIEDHTDEEIEGVLEKFKWRKPETEIWVASDEDEDEVQTWPWEHLNNVIDCVPNPKKVVLVNPHMAFDVSMDVPEEWIKCNSPNTIQEVLGGLTIEEKRYLSQRVFVPRVVYSRPRRSLIAPQPLPNQSRHILVAAGDILRVLFQNQGNFWEPVPVPDRRTPIDDTTKKRLGLEEKDKVIKSDVETPSSPKRRKTNLPPASSSTCSICLENNCSIACDPCGHMVMCPPCAKEILERDALGRKCPICRTPIERVLKIVSC